VPAPRVVPREPNSLLQANVKTDHRSQSTERRSEKKEEAKRHSERKKWERESDKDTF